MNDVIRVHLQYAALVLLTSTSAQAADPPITAVTFSPNGKQIVAGSQGGIVVRTWSDLKIVRKLKTKLEQVHDLKFSADGKHLLAAGGKPGDVGQVEIYEWGTVTPKSSIEREGDLIYGVCWTPDSKGFATAGLDRTVAVYRLGKSKPVTVIKGHSRGVKAVAILNDGKSLISGGIDNSLRVWSLPSGKPIRALNNHTRPIHDIAVRPKHEGLPMVATVSNDRTVRLWQPTIGRMVRFVRFKRAKPLAVRWTPNGLELVVVCSDGSVRVIDPDTAQVREKMLANKGWAYSVAVHPDGDQILVGGASGLAKVRYQSKKR